MFLCNASRVVALHKFRGRTGRARQPVPAGNQPLADGALQVVPFIQAKNLDAFHPLGNIPDGADIRGKQVQSPGDGLGKGKAKRFFIGKNESWPRPGQTTGRRRVIQPCDMFKTAMFPVRRFQFCDEFNGISGAG